MYRRMQCKTERERERHSFACDIHITYTRNCGIAPNASRIIRRFASCEIVNGSIPSDYVVAGRILPEVMPFRSVQRRARVEITSGREAFDLSKRVGGARPKIASPKCSLFFAEPWHQVEYLRLAPPLCQVRPAEYLSGAREAAARVTLDTQCVCAVKNRAAVKC